MGATLGEVTVAALHFRRATVDDTDAIVRILIASKEASSPDTIDERDRDVAFWTRRWRTYIQSGSRARESRGDGWVFIAEVENRPVGYVAYHHTTRHQTDAELQNIYVLKEWQGRGVGTHLLGLVAHRLDADGSRTMCVGYDANSPYKSFYLKWGAVETEPGAPWAIWHDVAALAAELPPPPMILMTTELHETRGFLQKLRSAMFDRALTRRQQLLPGMPLDIPVALAKKAYRYPEYSYGATRVILTLSDGTRIRDVFLSGATIVKIGDKLISDPAELGFNVGDIVGIRNQK